MRTIVTLTGDELRKLVVAEALKVTSSIPLASREKATVTYATDREGEVVRATVTFDYPAPSALSGEFGFR